jgi:hypothetical protein
MSEVIIFGVGCFVSLIVASAVGLLLWGAANEPRGGFVPGREEEATPPKPRASEATGAVVAGLESKGLA